MDQELRNHRKAQLEFLSKTINGRESIRRAYEACRSNDGAGTDCQVSVPQMIDAILDAEFPPDAGRAAEMS